MEVLYEDAQIIVCVKPVGISSQSANGEKGMPEILEEICKCKIYPVHRLDKSVGGVMVFAKDKDAAASLSAQIANHEVKKQYFALVHGKPDAQSGTLEDLIFKDRRTNKTYVVSRMRKGVKTAKLFYQSIGECEVGGKICTTVKVTLFTGRSHQIRVQFASRKHPLVGDGKYGAKDNVPKIELWSCLIEFNHPKSGEKMTFSAEAETKYLSKLRNL